MANNLSSLWNVTLWGQLLCFIIAVSFVAGGGQNADIANSYNSFVYLKALFLALPILSAPGWCAVSFFKIFDAFKTVLKQHGALLLYFVFAYLSLIFAYDRIFSLGRLIYTSGAVFSLWCLMAQYKMLAGDQLKSLIYRHLLKVFAVMLIGVPVLALVLSGAMTWGDLRGGIQTTGLIHPNTMASFSAYAFFHALFYRDVQTMWGKAVRYFVMAVAPILILLIFSRSVIAALILSMMITGWFAFIWHRSFKSLALIMGVTFAGVVGLLLMYVGVIPVDSVISSISRTGDGIDLFTLTHRTELWQRLLSEVDLKVAMLGNGYGVMTPGFGVDFTTGTIYGAHNIYLSIFLGTGIFSLIAFLGYLGGVFFHSRRHRNLHGVALLSFFMIHSMTSTEFSLNLSVSFALVMLMAALIVRQP